ncbi:MAG: hypothetical protein GF416_00920 [Candidatus Altiarchaeales archaeon]|nr:hypothetical protein [Candidatus Altiarchaeales archaeon]MBD3415680.1 hypothetical protein [Candidatus Altiarchaeales archaeon]
MDQDAVRDRLLRLNKEIHSERFSRMELTPVLQLWEHARIEYEKSNYGLVEEIIDEAYRILYGGGQQPPDDMPGEQPHQMGGRMHQQPQGQTPQQRMRGTPQQTEGQPQPGGEVPVYVVVDDKGNQMLVYGDGAVRGKQDISDRLFSALGGFFSLLLKTMVAPRLIFSRFPEAEPFKQTIACYLIFSLVISFGVGASILSVAGMSFSAVYIFLSLLFAGIVFCLFAAGLTHAVLRLFKAGGKFKMTASVYGFSLTPLAVGFSILLYLDYSMGVLSFETGVGLGNLLGFIIALAVGFGGLVWNLALQTVGYEAVHGLDRKSSVLAVLASTLAIGSFTMVSAMGLGAVSFIYWVSNSFEMIV